MKEKLLIWTLKKPTNTKKAAINRISLKSKKKMSKGPLRKFVESQISNRVRYGKYSVVSSETFIYLHSIIFIREIL